MTNDEDRTATVRALISALWFRHSLDIRHSAFVIYRGGPSARFASRGMTIRWLFGLRHPIQKK